MYFSTNIRKWLPVFNKAAIAWLKTSTFVAVIMYWWGSQVLIHYVTKSDIKAQSGHNGDINAVRLSMGVQCWLSVLIVAGVY